MVQCIVVLSEGALSPEDAGRIVALHDPERPAVRVLVPAGRNRNVLVDVLDHLSLLEVREAVEAAGGRPERTTEQAATDVSASVQALERLGCAASGEVVSDSDPVAALAAAVKDGADEAIVVTTPHAVEDTLHRDWGAVARERLGVPVLHFYAGSDWVGD